MYEEIRMIDKIKKFRKKFLTTGIITFVLYISFVLVALYIEPHSESYSEWFSFLLLLALALYFAIYYRGRSVYEKRIHKILNYIEPGLSFKVRQVENKLLDLPDKEYQELINKINME